MNFIYAKSDLLSKSTCNELIDLFECQKENHIDGYIVSNGVSTVDWLKKKSTDICIDDSYFTNSNWAFSLNKFYKLLSDQIKEYKDTFSEYQEGIPILGLECLDKWSIDIPFNFQKYNPNDGYFSWHCEVAGIKTSHRILAWMIYLNDVFEGGGTEFKFQDYKSPAEQGKLLIWPAYWTHIHRGIPSKTEVKYILTGWVSFIS